MDDVLKESVRFYTNKAIKKTESYNVDSMGLNPLIFIGYFAFVGFVIFKMYQK
jgi:hypothetical protein